MIFRAYPDAKSRQVLWQTIHLVSTSAHVDYNWQTINYIAVIVIIIIIKENNCVQKKKKKKNNNKTKIKRNLLW